MRHIYQSTSGDARGNVVPLMTVSVFLEDGITAANVYAASSGGSPVNAVTTANDGSFLFWVDDNDYSLNQRFKITLTRTGYITKSYNNISVFAPVPANTFYPDWNAVDQGATTNVWSVKSIINLVGSDYATIILRNCSGSITTPYTVATALTLPANIELRTEIGSMFVKSGSGTLTINGPVVGDPKHQWLSGFAAGEVTFGGTIDIIRPEWWGLVIGNSAGNESVNNTALQSAIDAAFGSATSTGRRTVKSPMGVIRYSQGLQLSTTMYGSQSTLEGANGDFYEADAESDQLTIGGGNTIFYYTGTGIAMNLRTTSVNLGKFRLEGTTAAIGGVKMGDKSGGGWASAQDYHFYDMCITGFRKTDAYGLLYDPESNNTGSVFDRVSFNYNYDNVVATFTTGFATVQRFNNCKFQFATRYGFWSDGGGVHTFEFFNPLFQHNGSSAMRVTEGSVAFTLYTPYFESNNKTISGKTVHFSVGGPEFVPQRASSMYNPTFISNEAQTTAEIGVNNVAGFHLFGGLIQNAAVARYTMELGESGSLGVSKNVTFNGMAIARNQGSATAMVYIHSNTEAELSNFTTSEDVGYTFISTPNDANVKRIKVNGHTAKGAGQATISLFGSEHSIKNCVNTAVSLNSGCSKTVVENIDGYVQLQGNNSDILVLNCTATLSVAAGCTNIIAINHTGAITGAGAGVVVKLSQAAANADTSGATLGQLETEVNELKALLRNIGLLAT